MRPTPPHAPHSLEGIRRLLVSIALAGCGLCPGSRAGASSTFAIETVDPRLVTNFFSMALDHLGRPRIAYRYGGGEGGSNGDLYYASRESGAWVLEPVDTLGDVGWDASLRLDTNDVPHIAYTDFTHNQLNYATLDGGNWVIETIEAPPAGYYVQQGSLAFDSNGDPHVAYGVNNVPLFRYASRNGGTWSTEIVASFRIALWISLEIDSQDVPHISYWDAANHLGYATKVGGAWSFETIETSDQYSPRYSSLALDSDAPEVAFYRPTSSSDGDLALATRGGSGWTTELVDTAGTTGYTPSLRLDGGEPRVSYYDVTNGSLRYARKISGIWSAETVDDRRNSGHPSSLGIDPDGHAWIAYVATGEANQNGHLMAAHEGATADVPKSRLEESPRIRVWPIPAASLVHVSISLPSAEIATLALHDLSGRAVASYRLDGSSAERYVFPLSGVAPGLYWLRLTRAEGSIARPVVVIR
jgi:hypothetical protein